VRQILMRTWRYLDHEPGPISSFLILIAVALALGAMLNSWMPPY
jgi:hypothetical protein